MKLTTKLILSLLIVTATSFTRVVFAQCKERQIAKSCKPLLKPYLFDDYAISDLEFKLKPHKELVEFTVFGGQKYKLLFCTSGFTENVVINIYDKKNTASKPVNPVFSSGEKPSDKSSYEFTPKKTTTYYIEYDVPAAKGMVNQGCMVMFIGYQEGLQTEMLRKSKAGADDDEE